MENNARNDECENPGTSSGTKKEENASQNVQSCTDAKVVIDTKNTQVRVVRGTKKMKLDVSDNNNPEKKGSYPLSLYCFICKKKTHVLMR